MKKCIALIGLGIQCKTELTPAVLSLGDLVDVVAVCDTNNSSMIAELRLLPSSDVKTYKDYNTLFRDVLSGKLALDAVIVSVPHHIYGDIVAKAISAKVMVFKEKPFAHDLKEAEKISQIALKNHVQVYTVTKRQFYPSYMKALQLLKKGAIGTPYMYNARHFIPHGNLYQGWRSTIDVSGGGVLMDMGYHLLDVLIRYFGDVKQANLHWSNIAKPEFSYEVEDAASLLCQHPNGVHGVFQVAALSGPKEESIEIRGTKGRLIITKDKVTLYDIHGEEKQSFELKADSVIACTKAMSQFLLNDINIWSENLSHNMQVMHALDIAYNNGEKIK